MSAKVKGIDMASLLAGPSDNAETALPQRGADVLTPTPLATKAMGAPVKYDHSQQRRLSLTIPVEDYKALKHLGADTEQTLQTMCAQAISEYLQRSRNQ